MPASDDDSAGEDAITAEINRRPDADDDSDPESTSSISKRWIFTNDLLAFILLGSLPILTAVGATRVLALSQVPDSWILAYLAITGTAAVWAFGTDALEAWRSK
jgi:hypothetical protein